MSAEIIPFVEWRDMPTEQRLTRLLGMSTDRCLDWLSVDPRVDEMSAGQISAQIQVIRAVLHTCVKLGIESKRLESVREKVLGDLLEGLDRRAEERDGSKLERVERPKR